MMSESVRCWRLKQKQSVLNRVAELQKGPIGVDSTDSVYMVIAVLLRRIELSLECTVAGNNS